MIALSFTCRRVVMLDLYLFVCSELAFQLIVRSFPALEVLVIRELFNQDETNSEAIRPRADAQQVHLRHI